MTASTSLLAPIRVGIGYDTFGRMRHANLRRITYLSVIQTVMFSCTTPSRFVHEKPGVCVNHFGGCAHRLLAESLSCTDTPERTAFSQMSSLDRGAIVAQIAQFKNQP